MGFRERFPEYIRFKEGDQWPPATARTRNLPRPVFNIVEMFIRTKRAAVLNPHIAMTYLPVTEEAAQGARDGVIGLGAGQEDPLPVQGCAHNGVAHGR